jgi:hypothetical protein
MVAVVAAVDTAAAAVATATKPKQQPGTGDNGGPRNLLAFSFIFWSPYDLDKARIVWRLK